MLLHKQASQDLAAWSEMLSLSGAEREYIDESIKPERAYSSREGTRAIRDDFPKGALYDLWNTKPEEIAAKKRESDFAERERRRKSEKGDV